MKPIIPNFKEPWKVCPKQLAELDLFIQKEFPNAKLDVGLKYARWAVLEGVVPVYFSPDHPYKPDYIFMDKIFGRETTIYMWLPFFD